MCEASTPTSCENVRRGHGDEAQDGKVIQRAAPLPTEHQWLRRGSQLRCEQRSVPGGPSAAPNTSARFSGAGSTGIGMFRALIFVAVSLSVLPGRVMAQCPNSCSGHGTCGSGSVCNCFAGWQYAADCSERTCSMGPAWADKAYAADTAHTDVECSNAGLCDRSTGMCACFDGYSGAACTRSLCPNECSGNGQCMTIGDMGQFEGRDYDQPGIGGDGVGPVYSNWDKASTTACVCYAGFFGPDCSSLMCPKADDPVSVNQEYRSIEISIGSTSTDMSGTVSITFNGYTTSFAADADTMTPNLCKEAFEKLDNVEEVICNATASTNANTDDAKYNVTFKSFPLVVTYRSTAPCQPASPPTFYPAVALITLCHPANPTTPLAKGEQYFQPQRKSEHRLLHL
mmetsp:Transcript_5521/g.12283  ORF Transcript_5521/g.12283 Transcript_5521/m.12283 type:complete len:399 (+) Transcript_5521:282-1478(+)